MLSLQRLLDLDRPLIMGILNVTPDSFSDGGRYFQTDQAILHADAMLDAGADIIDVGGESTRPGARRVSGQEQITRIIPVLRELALRFADRCVFSVDTTCATVARAACDSGARLINDISAGTEDENMFRVVRDYGVPIVLMHMQGTPATMQDNPTYDDVLSEVSGYLVSRANAAIEAGIPSQHIVLDPGLGFGKSSEHNLSLIAGLGRFVEIGYPVLLGASRKRFMGKICGQLTPDELEGATAATTALGVQAGVRIFRVHDIRFNRQAADVADHVRKMAQNSGATGNHMA